MARYVIIIKLVQICNRIMIIVKLGKVEKSILKLIEGNEAIEKNSSNCRAIKRLKEKGLIVAIDDGYRSTDKAKELALTEKEKNNLRNDRKTNKIFGAKFGLSKTYMSYALALKEVFGKEGYQELMTKAKGIKLYKAYEMLKKAKLLAYYQIMEFPIDKQNDELFYTLIKEKFYFLLAVEGVI